MECILLIKFLYRIFECTILTSFSKSRLEGDRGPKLPILGYYQTFLYQFRIKLGNRHWGLQEPPCILRHMFWHASLLLAISSFEPKPYQKAFINVFEQFSLYLRANKTVKTEILIVKEGTGPFVLFIGGGQKCSKCMGAHFSQNYMLRIFNKVDIN